MLPDMSTTMTKDFASVARPRIENSTPWVRAFGSSSGSMISTGSVISTGMAASWFLNIHQLFSEPGYLLFTPLVGLGKLLQFGLQFLLPGLQVLQCPLRPGGAFPVTSWVRANESSGPAWR